MTEPSTPDPEWFEDPRFEDIFASWADSGHPPAGDPDSAGDTNDDVPGSAEDAAEPAPQRDGGGDAPDLWSDAGAGLAWDLPDPRRAWPGPDDDDADADADDDADLDGEGDLDQEEAEPEPPADTGPWARQRDDVIPERRRRWWGRRS